MLARPLVCSLVLAAWSSVAAERDLPCNLAASLGTDATCALSQQCPGEPVRTIACEDATCTCWAGDEQAGECASGDVCRQLDPVQQLEQLAGPCCGFELHRD
ncbi:hypothetical protein [Nannocystis punicea]|uniref:Thyroglobulin type-1 domain-containing protein n=1 Tax=Nannocystis punicea TaxID=2995304 RepID=A0ABY7H5Q9_9BACT|nr:hypothetical protein [Nannocystis poenicansa]WAS94601.1 hypothetical protein O0S08_00440 [Nannocystis poenicansa]